MLLVGLESHKGEKKDQYLERFAFYKYLVCLRKFRFNFFLSTSKERRDKINLTIAITCSHY